MKNIWKFMIVALMAIAMVGCPDPNKGDDEGGKKEKEGTFTSFEGVYSYSDEIANISAAWGGSPASPTFSIMLMDEIAIEAMKNGDVADLKEMPVGSPVYQLQGKDNASFLTAIDGTWNTQYAGMCAKVANPDYTLFIDGSKIVKTELKGIGQDFGTEGEKVLTKADDCDLTGYVPVMLALTDRTDDNYIAPLWNGNLVKMVKTTAEYPSDAKTAVKVTCSIKFTGRSHIDAIDKVAFPDNSADVEWTVTNVEYYEGAKVPFNFFADNSGSTNEVATDGATLTATLVAGGFDWEAAEAPAAFASYKIAKKCNIGLLSDVWLAFNALTDTFDAKKAEK